MTYDEKLAERIRSVIPLDRDIVERKMFGGIAFLVDGKMFAGVTNDDLMVRVGADAYAAMLGRPHARPMDFTGRPLTGFIYVGAAGARTAKAVGAWVERAMAFADTLVTKEPRKRRPRPRRKVRRL
jgi:TfoX/Sxy family transcriptional regulator of competence genes